MYAIVKTGGKQYRVEEGQSLLVERLPVDGGGKAELTPLLVVDGSNVVDGSDLAKATVEARVVGHERGPKLRVVKFKPKRGYKRRTGHRQELTRIEVTSIKLGGSRRGSSGTRAPKPVAAEGPGAGTAAEAAGSGGGAGTEAAGSGGGAGVEAAEKPAARTRARKAGGETAGPRAKAEPAADEAKTEEGKTEEGKTEEGNGA
jgi:large subunit ribosomal protein L21